MADRKSHRSMTREEQVRRSQSRYGGGASHAAHAAGSRASKRSRTAGAHAASRSDGATAYADRRRKKSRGRALRVALITVLVALVGVGAAAAAYIAHINSALSNNVSDDLRAQLSEPVQQSDPFYMLLLGVDKSEARAEDWGGDASNFRSDTIILARIDAPAQKVTLVSIPRDTMVDMGEYGERKINDAYSIGQGAYMVETVEKFAGVDISAYAEVDFEQLISIVDTIGGIEITLPRAVQDELADVDLPAGTQTINGAQALGLCRARHAYDDMGGGDFYRAANQRMVIGAIVKKVLQLDPVTMLSTVSQLAEGLTVYPFSVTDIVGLARQFQNFDVDNGFYSGQTPTTSTYTNNLWYEIPDEQAWTEMMERVDAGLPPYSDESQDFTAGVAGSIGISSGDGSSDGSGSGDEATFTGSVLVLNGTNVNGLAMSHATDLEEAGFSVLADNASTNDQTTTMIYYNGSAASKARGVAQTLGVDESNIAENPGDFSTDYDVVVILGSDQSK